MSDGIELRWWDRLAAAWVERDGERIGWISEHPTNVGVYNAANDTVGRVPDRDSALRMLQDERAQVWRSLPSLRREFTGCPHGSLNRQVCPPCQAEDARRA